MKNERPSFLKNDVSRWSIQQGALLITNYLNFRLGRLYNLPSYCSRKAGCTNRIGLHTIGSRNRWHISYPKFLINMWISVLKLLSKWIGLGPNLDERSVQLQTTQIELELRVKFASSNCHKSIEYYGKTAPEVNICGTSNKSCCDGDSHRHFWFAAVFEKKIFFFQTIFFQIVFLR